MARPYLILVMVVVLVYLPSLWYGFTGHDDYKIVVELHQFFGNLGNAKQLFAPNPFMEIGNGSFWRPILGLSFMFDAGLWGQWLPGYHLTNLLIHMLAVSAVFVFLGRLGYRQSLAFPGALIVAVHPALAQSVAWLPGRNDTLLAVFVLVSLIALLQFFKRGGLTAALAGIVSYTLALMTKETAIVLPLVALTLSMIVPKCKLPRQQQVLLWAGLLLPSILFLVIRAGVVSQPIEYASFLPQLPTYLMVDLPKIALVSLGKLVLFGQLSPILPLASANVSWGVAALVTLGVALARSRKRRGGYILLGLGWFVLFLLPTYPPHTPNWLDPLMDHRLWLPLVGVLIMFLESDLVKRWVLQRRTFSLRRVVILVVLAAWTILYSQTFSDEVRYAQRIVQLAPQHSSARYVLENLSAGR